MNIEKLRNLLKEQKCVLIDYTEKFKLDVDFEATKENKELENDVMIKTAKIFAHMDYKLMRNTNLVFLLDISKLAKYNPLLHMLLVSNSELPLDTNVLYLKNSDNFMWFKNGEDIKNNIITNFINQKEKGYECNVCFEEYGVWRGGSTIGGSYCGVCDFRTCAKCFKKASEHNLNNSCFGCRKHQSNKYIMMN